MTVSLLVVTPHPSFGELIRQSLEETDSYSVRVVNSYPGAVSAIQHDGPSVALLDLDVERETVIEIGKALHLANPDIFLTLISGEETPADMEAIRPWAVLHKPFYLPDLLQLLGEKTISADEPNLDDLPESILTNDAEEDVPWLQDVNKAAQHLTRLTLESSSQAALITRQDQLWAYAGQLSQAAANEIAAAIARYWDIQKESDLLRFIRLEATKAEHMLYATRLAPGVIMALTFDAETPFSTIRSQATRLAQSLAIPDPKASLPTPEALPAPDVPSIQPDNILIGNNEEDVYEIPSISSILYDIPSPVPDPGDRFDSPILRAVHTNRKVVADADGEIEYPDSVIETRPSDPSNQKQFSREASPAIPLSEMAHTHQSAQGTDIEQAGSIAEDLDSTLPSKARRSATPVRTPKTDELGETKPSSPKDGARSIVLEPVSPALYNLTYACLLVPRFSAHYMGGDLGERISEWIQEICVAFGWRLEYLAVRPEYLQWVVNVPPSTSPGYLMRIIRQQTSERIFVNFLRLRQENPSGDFWAPGYLIMGGDHPHPPQLVKDYINQIRQRQGISRPRPRR